VKPCDHRTFDLKTCFPPEKVSRKLCWHNLIFPYLKGNASWTFGLVTAVLYSTPTFLFVTLTVLGFLFFTDTHSFRYRMIMGGVHALAHVLAAFTTALVCVSVVAHLSTPDGWRFDLPLGGYQIPLDTRMLLAALLIFIGGSVLGPFIMGLYLPVSMNVFGRHSNEAFSLAIQDWKHFLHLHIDRHGDLTSYPIGIRRVPRHWKARRTGDPGPQFVPDDPQAIAPELIEPPIPVKKARTETRTGVKTSAE
jgi:hypothetical protein